MDNYTIDEVKRIIQSNLLTKEVLNSIVESSTRRIEIFGDKNSIEILKFLKDIQTVPLEIKNDIDNFLNNCQNSISNVDSLYYNDENKSYLFYLIIGSIFVLLGALLMFFNYCWCLGMNRKINNEQNIINLKKRELLRIFIIIFSILTIVFSLGNLFYEINLIFALLFFILTVVLNKIREKIIIIRKDELKEYRKEINKNKKQINRH